MKLNKTSYASIAPVIQDALKKYASMEGKSVVTDIYLQPQMQTGELAVYMTTMNCWHLLLLRDGMMSIRKSSCRVVSWL